MDPTQPYNDLPLLPPAEDVETAAILKRVITARERLAAARLASAELPNPSILINSIPLLEARDSSRIENIVTTSDELFLHQGSEDVASSAAKEAFRYRTALLAGFESLDRRPLSTTTAVEICSTLHDREMQIRKVPGTTLADSAGRVIYTPPAGEGVIRDKLSNWEQYIHNTGVDALVRLAVSHYQFEAIHPFTDGNGRTGRILNSLLLVQEGLIDEPTLYLSRYILATRDEYYGHLRAVTSEGAWEPWILYMLKGIEEVSSWTTQRVKAITQLVADAESHIRSGAPAIYSRELLDVLFSQPYCRIRNLVEHGIAKRQTASTYLKRLADLGLLEEQVHGRDKVFINRALLATLEAG